MTTCGPTASITLSRRSFGCFVRLLPGLASAPFHERCRRFGSAFCLPPQDGTRFVLGSSVRTFRWNTHAVPPFPPSECLRHLYPFKPAQVPETGFIRRASDHCPIALRSRLALRQHPDAIKPSSSLAPLRGAG